MSDETIRVSLEPEPETVTGIPPISDTEENPFSEEIHEGRPPVSPLEKIPDIDPALRREMLAGEIYRDILNVYWPKLSRAGLEAIAGVDSADELFEECAARAVQAADALDEALRSE